MRSFGIWIVVIGVLGFIYPLFGKRLIILSFLDKSSMPIASGIIVAVGVVLFIVSFFIKKKKKAAVTSDTTSASQSGEGNEPRA